MNPPRIPHAILLPAFACTLVAACAPATPPRLTAAVDLPSPAAPGGATPRLATSPAGGVLMTWFEPGEADSHLLRFARLEGDAWSAPVTIARGDSFFVNWADFPALIALDETRLAVSYPWRSGEDPYAYDVMIRMSADGGATWGPPIRPHTDGTATEHGFVTLLAEAGRLRVVWLDGRNFAGHGGHESEDEGPGADMTLRTALIGADGTLAGEAVVDPRTCDCCGTAGLSTGAGAVLAYRDRSAGEVRDISLVRGTGGDWSDPVSLHADGWEIPGCPVNGPALAGTPDGAAIAWYTGARDTAAVYVAFAGREGEFGEPVRVDGGQPLGRTGVAMLEDGSAVVSWMEAAADTAEVRLVRVRADGHADPPLVLARNSPRRSSGFPQLVRDGSRLVCAWTEPGTPSRLRVAAVPLAAK